MIPRVNSTGLVTMDIEQEISAVVNQSAAPNLTPTISQRQVASAISVYSGQMVVLGGLISEQRNHDKSGPPILGQIPVLGDLIGATSKGARRTEFVVFIRPQVIRDSRDARDVSEELRSRLRSLAPAPVEQDWRTQTAGGRKGVAMRPASPVRLSAALALASLLGGWMLAEPLWAGEARLVAGEDRDRVVLETTDATTDEILTVLANHFGFSVERSAAVSQPVRLSGPLQGSLDEVLARLLRHEGHMIVRSQEARAGISRVLILEARGRLPAPTLPNPIAALKARLQAGEQDSGN